MATGIGSAKDSATALRKMQRLKVVGKHSEVIHEEERSVQIREHIIEQAVHHLQRSRDNKVRSQRVDCRRFRFLRPRLLTFPWFLCMSCCCRNRRSRNHDFLGRILGDGEGPRDVVSLGDEVRFVWGVLDDDVVLPAGVDYLARTTACQHPIEMKIEAEDETFADVTAST